jgi:hypothetical protein
VTPFAVGTAQGGGDDRLTERETAVVAGHRLMGENFESLT